MNILEMQELGVVGEDLLENLEEISNSVSEIKKADFTKESTFEDTDHLQEYIQDTINIIKRNLTKLKSK
jgi:ribosomal protein S18